MSDSEKLRKNLEQHKPKNLESQKDDKRLYAAMRRCLVYLREEFADDLRGYHLSHEKQISYGEMIALIRGKGAREEFDATFASNTIRPDGGVIWLTREGDEGYKKVVLVSEAKKQGTNAERMQEGKRRQAQGNAIERLGKNLTGIKAMMNHENITPFVCFGWGCDFEENYDGSDFVMSKISMLNEFYRLNEIHIYKIGGGDGFNSFSPVSMFFREEMWDEESMLEILKEIGKEAIIYYLVNE